MLSRTRPNRLARYLLCWYVADGADKILGAMPTRCLDVVQFSES